MNNHFLGALILLVIYLDVYLLVTCIFKLKMKYKLYPSIILVLVVGILSEFFLNDSLQDFIEIVLPVLVIGFNLYNKKDLTKLIFATVLVTMLDSLVSILNYLFIPESKISIYNYDATKFILEIPVFLLILVISLIVYKKKFDFSKYKLDKYILVYSFAGLSIIANISVFSLYFLNLNMSLDRIVVVLLISTSLAVITLVLLVFNLVKNDRLEYEIELSNKVIANQIEYFKVMEEKDSQTKAFRHDIRKHLFCMRHLSENKEYEELAKYIDAMCENVTELSPEINTGNSLMSSILSECIRQCPKVNARWEGHLPSDMGISNIDLCTIFYNLVLNAFEAANKKLETMTSEERQDDRAKLDCDVYIEMSMTNVNKILTIKNKRISPPVKIRNRYITSKQGEGHGYGLKNAMNVLNKLDGSLITSDDGYIYTTEIIIPNQNS